MKKKTKFLINKNTPPKFTAEDMFIMLLEERRIIQKKQLEENLATIDERFAELAELVGRMLTDEEGSAILDIVDELTPKKPDGNYLCALLPFDYAWEVYETKNAEL